MRRWLFADQLGDHFLDGADRVAYVRAESFRTGLAEVGEPVAVCAPLSYDGRRLVAALPGVTVLPERGFVTSAADFARWATGRGRRRLLLEDFYRDARRRLGVLMDGDEPAGGRWNVDRENREPPPRAARLDVAEPWRPVEDDVDAPSAASIPPSSRRGSTRRSSTATTG